MALIVEDGTGLPNADSYLSVVGADTYHAAMGNAAWQLASSDEREVALRRATQYIGSRYTFSGSRMTQTQALDWPRDTAQWPVAALTAATAEAAVRALSGPLYVDASDAPVTQETVGPISVSYGVGTNGGQARLTIIDDLLRPLLGGAGRMSLRLERAS